MSSMVRAFFGIGMVFSAAAQSRPVRLDPTNFIVIGDGLAAGQADFGLSRDSQEYSFPNLMAQSMRTLFPQPLLQAPGLHDVVGEPPQSVRPPFLGTGAVRVTYRATPEAAPGPSLFIFNLSVPNARLRDALTRRPAHPLVHEHDRQQTSVNLLIGFPQLLFETDVPLWTQVEYALAMNPSLAMVELGYFDVLDAAARSDPGALPELAAFRRDYDEIVRRLRQQFAEVVVTTIPDPFDTAFFSTPAFAAALTRTPLPDLLSRFNLDERGFLTRQGLMTAGYRLMAGETGPLPTGQFAGSAVAAAVGARTRELNQEIERIARERGAVVFDLNGFFRRVRANGVAAGSARLTADYLGRFYSLDGFHPGRTGHALIANEGIALLNRTYGTSYPPVDVAKVWASDPASRHAGIRAEDIR